MAESTIWWLLTGAGVAVELATGTFYLLTEVSALITSAMRMVQTGEAPA